MNMMLGVQSYGFVGVGDLDRFYNRTNPTGGDYR